MAGQLRASTQNPRRKPGGVIVAAVSLCALTLSLVATGAGAPGAAVRDSAAAPGAEPLMQVRVDAARWVADGAAVVVTGRSRCSTPTDDQTTFTLTQASGAARTVSAEAGVPAVECDGANHPWSRVVAAGDETSARWRTGPATVTLATPTEAVLVDVYSTRTLALGPGSLGSARQITKVERQIDGLSLTVRFRLSCPANLEEIFSIDVSVNQRIAPNRVLRVDSGQGHVSCTPRKRIVPILVPDPGPGWDPDAPLVATVGYATCTESGCISHEFTAIRRPAAPEPAADVMVDPNASLVARGAAALVTFRTRCDSPGVKEMSAAMRQRRSGDPAIHGSFQNARIGPCSSRLREFTVPIPAATNQNSLGRQDPLDHSWRPGPALVSLSFGDEFGENPTVVQAGVTLTSNALPPDKPGPNRPRIQIDGTVRTRLAATEVTATIHVTCAKQRAVLLSMTASQSHDGVAQVRDGFEQVACGPTEAGIQVSTIELQRGFAWQTGEPIFVSVAATSVGSSALTRVWRTAKLRSGPNPARPPTPRNVEVLGINALAHGAGAVVHARIVCPDGPRQVDPRIHVIQPVGDTAMAYYQSEFFYADCGPVPLDLDVLVHSREGGNSNMTQPLTPGKRAVVTVVVPGAGAEQRSVELRPGNVTDPTIRQTAFTHAGGMALEVRLRGTCAERAGQPVTVAVHQVVARGTVLQTVFEDDTVACGRDGNLAPVLVEPLEQPWLPRSTLVVVRPADCDDLCEPPESVVAVVRAASDPVPPDSTVRLRVVSAARHLDGAFATVKVALRCPDAPEFRFVTVGATQADGAGSRAGAGQASRGCDAAVQLFPVLLAAASDVPLRLGTTFIRATSEFPEPVASTARTLQLQDGGALQQDADDGALVAPPTLRDSGAVLQARVRLAACDPGNSLLFVGGATQLNAGGRVHSAEGEEFRHVCSGQPQTVRVHFHATGGSLWRAGPAVIGGGFGEVCAFDFSSCTEVDVAFLRTVRLAAPGQAGSFAPGSPVRLPGSLDTGSAVRRCERLPATPCTTSRLER